MRVIFSIIRRTLFDTSIIVLAHTRCIEAEIPCEGNCSILINISAHCECSGSDHSIFLIGRFRRAVQRYSRAPLCARSQVGKIDLCLRRRFCLVSRPDLQCQGFDTEQPRIIGRKCIMNRDIYIRIIKIILLLGDLRRGYKPPAVISRLNINPLNPWQFRLFRQRRRREHTKQHDERQKQTQQPFGRVLRSFHSCSSSCFVPAAIGRSTPGDFQSFLRQVYHIRKNFSTLIPRIFYDFSRGYRR